MGVRAHVITQENKNDGGEYFNNRMPEVMDMFDNNGIPFEIGRKDHWMIDCENGAFQRYVDKLETLPPDEIHEDFLECSNAYTNEWVFDCLKAWLQHIDPKENVIRLYWR